MNNFINHPIYIVNDIIKSFNNVKEIEMSIYTYKPQSIIDDRIICKLDSHTMINSFFNLLTKINQNQEIAFHSRCYVKNGSDMQEMHIPMIDFKSDNIDNILYPTEKILQELESDGYLVFSGRSYHLYIKKLLAPAEWIRFMGRILLMNGIDHPEVTDTRWVGHRLMAGYGSLRWTRNTGQYMAAPTLVETIKPNQHICTW